jgi:hypothetical protein
MLTFALTIFAIVQFIFAGLLLPAHTSDKVEWCSYEDNIPVNCGITYAHSPYMPGVIVGAIFLASGLLFSYLTIESELEARGMKTIYNRLFQSV